MPTLEELYKKHMQQMQQGGQALGSAALSPFSTGLGAIKGLGKVVLDVGSTLLDIPQAFRSAGSVQPGGASGPIVPEGSYDPKWSAPGQGNPSALPEWKQRLGLVANALTLGMGRSVADTYKQTGTIDDTVVETVKNFLPFHESAAIVSGESRTNPGQLMTPEEYGENLVHFGLKAIPAVKGIKAIHNFRNNGVIQHTPSRHALSVTEIAEGKLDPMTPAVAEQSIAAKQLNLATKRDALMKAIEYRNNLPKDALPGVNIEAADNIANLAKDVITSYELSPEFAKQTFGNLSKNPEAALGMIKNFEAVGRGDAKLASTTKILIDTLKTEGGAQSMMDLLAKYNIPETAAPVVFTHITDALTSSAKNSGGVLKSLSDAQKNLAGGIERMRSQGILGEEQYQSFKAIQKSLDLKNEPIHLYSKIANRYKNWNEIWRGAATSQPTGHMRNAQVGLGVFASQLFDSTLLGLETYGASKLLQTKLGGKLFNNGAPLAAEEAASFTEAMFPAFDKLATMQKMLMGGEKTFSGWLDYMTRRADEDRLIAPIAKGIDAIYNEYPGEINKMLGGQINDIHVMNLMSDGLRGAPKLLKAKFKNIETPMDAARFGVSVINTANTAQELFWRKYFFTTRVNEKLHKFGYKNPQEFITKLQADKGLKPEYFGKAYDAAGLDQFINTGLKSKLAESYKERLNNFKAQAGEKLHKADLDRAKVTHNEFTELVNEQLTTAKTRLGAGEDWYKIANDLNPEVARLVQGEIRHPSEIVTDGADHAMRSTFAATPQHGTFGHTLLGAYEKFPFLYTLGSPFPRFAINSMNWILEHNPMDLAKTPMYTPNFLRTLNDVAKNPRLVTNPAAIKQFEQAHTGAVLWAGAHTLANNPDLKGPKYYQVKAGEDERGHPIYADMRPYQPFVQYMFLEQVGRDLANNRIPNLTSAELTEALTGLRRLSEVPVFAAADVIRQADSSNPEAFVNSLKPLVGQSLAGIFTPFRIPGDIAGALGVDSAVTQKDISGNELIGPSVNQFPILREALPDRIDPFTGQIAKQQHPAIRMLGPSLRSATKLEEEVSKTNIPLNTLLGNFSDPEADRLVRKYVGQILGRTTPENELLSDRLGQRLQELSNNMPNEYRNTVVREVFTNIRQAALQMAMQENPYAFIEHMVRQQPEAVRPILRGELKKHKAEAVRRQIQGAK